MHPLRPVSVSGHSKRRFPVQRDLEGAASHPRRPESERASAQEDGPCKRRGTHLVGVCNPRRFVGDTTCADEKERSAGRPERPLQVFQEIRREPAAMTRNTPEDQVRYAKTRDWSLRLFDQAIIPSTALTKQEQEQAAASTDRLRLPVSDRAYSALMRRRSIMPGFCVPRICESRW